MPSPDQPRQFATTRWSLIVAAQADNESDAARALEQLCRDYWYPLYACVRRYGYSAQDAEDLTQAFFARLLARDLVGVADRNKGRFRTFLLTALKRFMAQEWEKAKAGKRGGGHVVMSLDTDLAERLYADDAGSDKTPDALFQRRWALRLLEAALDRMATDWERRGKSEEFATFKPYLTAERGEVPYPELADQLGRDEGAARVALHRFRQGYRAAVRDEVAQTISTDRDIDDELHLLMDALR